MLQIPVSIIIYENNIYCCENAQKNHCVNFVKDSDTKNFFA